MVNVIIPTYNRAELLPGAIDSVLAQTFKDYEIIIIDDGSTDGTRKVLSPYLLHPNIRYFYQDNKKQAAAKNLGIQKAQGEYIAFLDSDDLWSPQKLALQVKALDDHPEIAMVYSNQMIFRNSLDSGKIKYRPGILKSGEIFYDLLMRKFYCSTPTILLRKSAIDAVGGFDESLRNALEDWEFTLRISKIFQIYCIDKPLIWRRIHAEGSPGYHEIRIRNHSRILDKYLSDSSLSDSFKKAVLGKAYFSWGHLSFLDRRYKKATRYFSKATLNGHIGAFFAVGLCQLREVGRMIYLKLYNQFFRSRFVN